MSRRIVFTCFKNSFITTANVYGRVINCCSYFDNNVNCQSTLLTFYFKRYKVSEITDVVQK